MSPRRFWPFLAAVAVATLAVLAIMQSLYPQTTAVSPFTMVTVGVFTAIVAWAYVQGVKAAKGPSKYQFVRLTLMLIVVKMLISVLLVVWYVETARPESKAFVLPFLLIYLIFTVYEVYVMEKVARMKPESDNG